LLIFASLATLALNIADPVVTGAYGRAAFDAVGPLLLIGWAEVGPGLLQSISAMMPQVRDFDTGDEGLAQKPIPERNESDEDARGAGTDRGKLRAPRFHGQYYDVEGVQPFPRSPQGHPVLVQAGQSAAGIGLAARYAELVFSGPPSLEAAVAFRTDLHARVAAADRDPEQVAVLPALMVTLGGTEAEARARAQQLEELVSPEFRWQNALYTAGLDPDAFDPDAPLPVELWTGQSTPSSHAEQLFAAARARPDASLREVAQHVTGGAGQVHFVGTPEQLAAQVIVWQDAGAVDGFTIMGSTLPYELTAFVDHVVPILQRQGRFRTEYAGHTLRDHLGLPRPIALVR
jgi:alkanesulfonate monooxygenase SsuD/methylene tetrahydromethanopterin reductase-like flavin-dependent oxidoreductase (luciferase family)